MRKLIGVALVFVLAISPLYAADVDKFVPADAEQVAYLDVRQALGSALFKKHGQKVLEDYLKNDKNVAEAMKALNFDPLKDLDSVLVANSGATGEKTLVVLRGTFDEAQLKKLFEADTSGKHAIHKEGDLVVYELKDKDFSVYGTFADKGTLVLSMTKDVAVKAVQGKGGKPGKEITAAIKSVAAKQTFWIVALVPDEVKKILANQEVVADIAPKLKLLIGAVKCTDNAAVALAITTDDEKAATEMEKYLETLKTIASFYADTNETYGPLVKDLMKTYKVTSEKTTTTVNVTLSDKLVETVMTKIPKK